MLGEVLDDRVAELAPVELTRAALREALERVREVAHDDLLARGDPSVLPVDRPALGRVPQDEVEDRMQVGLRSRQLDAVPGERDRRLDQAPPGQRRVALVRRLEARHGTWHGAGPGPDEEDLRRRPVEVDVDRLHVRLDRPAGALPGQRDEEVEQAIRLVAGPVHEQEPARRRPRERALGDPGGEGGGEARVDGVAALGKDFGAGLGRQRVPGSDRASHRGKRSAASRLSFE